MGWLLAGGCLKSHSVGAGNGIMAVQTCSNVCIGAIWKALMSLKGINDVYTSNQMIIRNNASH